MVTQNGSGINSYFPLKSELWPSLPPLYSVKICHCDGINKEDEWPLAEQDKARWESETENAGRLKGGVWSLERRCREKKEAHAELRKSTKPCGIA